MSLLKDGKLEQFVSCGRREFHILGAETAKSLSPKLLWVRGTATVVAALALHGAHLSAVLVLQVYSYRYRNVRVQICII